MAAVFDGGDGRGERFLSDSTLEQLKKAVLTRNQVVKENTENKSRKP